MRLAVGVGRPRPVRIAVVAKPGGMPKVLAHPPDTPSAVTAVRRALATITDVEELVLVHPPWWPPSRVRAEVAALTPLARTVRTCSAALAAARESHARFGVAPGPLAVLDVDAEAAAVTVFADLAGGVVLAGRRHGRGADPAGLLAAEVATARLDPDELTGGVVLSYRPARVADLEGKPGGAPPPQLVRELTDLVGVAPLVPDDPRAAEVLGALRAGPVDPKGGTRGPGELPTKVGAAVLWTAAEHLGAGLLAPLPPPSRLRPVLLGVGVPVLAALLTAAAVDRGATVFTRTAEDVASAGAHGVLAQYDYVLRVPAGWRHAGGLPARRRTLLTPEATPDGSDLISVEQTLLGYDSAAEPDRAFREFQARYQQSLTGGAQLDQLTLSTRVAGRDVIAYRQRQPERDASVDWYVLFDRGAQLSVGCQHTEAGAQVVRDACARVVGSLALRR